MRGGQGWRRGAHNRPGETFRIGGIDGLDHGADAVAHAQARDARPDRRGQDGYRPDGGERRFRAGAHRPIAAAHGHLRRRVQDASLRVQTERRVHGGRGRTPVRHRRGGERRGGHGYGERPRRQGLQPARHLGEGQGAVQGSPARPIRQLHLVN